MNKKLIYMLAVCMAFLVTACERRSLVDESEKVRVKVVVKVNDVLNVNAGIYNPNVPVPSISPEIVHVIFYDVDTKAIVTQSFISGKGVDADGNEYLVGDVNIRPGTYDLLAYNFDTPSTLVKDEKNWNTITAYTSEIADYLYSRFSSRSGDNADPEPKIYYEPDHLVVAREYGVKIEAHASEYLIEVDATSIVDTYYIQVRVKNGKYAADATAVLTDLVPSNKFALNERKTDEYAATFFEMQRSTDANITDENKEVLCAVFNTFGKRPDDIDPSVESKLYVVFNVITVDGKMVEMTVDMDELFLTEDARERHWLFVEKVFEIPEPDPTTPTDGGFKPTVNDWEKTYGNIEL